MPDTHPIYAQLEEKLGYSFNNKEILAEALQHPSLIGTKNNQRLEFLGDRVIGLVIADALFHHLRDEREGKLTHCYAQCVSNKRLAKIGRHLGLGTVLSVQNEVLADNDKALADAVEAVLGAVWCDGGIESAQRVILLHWGDLVTTSIETDKDFKTQLQELAHRRDLTTPVYNIVDQIGVAHAPLFKVSVTCGGTIAIAEGKSRRAAEQMAAQSWIANNNLKGET